MSSIDAVGSSQQASQQLSSVTSTTTKELGTSQFLQLMIAQLQNQDPLNPADGQQFLTQLATFSSLEQLVSINQGVSKLAGVDSESTAKTT
jgi:flagellar basal-body rod modification protein FlgD